MRELVAGIESQEPRNIHEASTIPLPARFNLPTDARRPSFERVGGEIGHITLVNAIEARASTRSTTALVARQRAPQRASSALRNELVALRNELVARQRNQSTHTNANEKIGA